MADARLQVIIDAQSRLSETIRSTLTDMDKLSAAAKDLGKKSVVAGAALGAALAASAKQAANAEGALAKFNTVFGDGSDEMQAFINELRKEMPTARGELIRMTADMQDLLVPMGLARDEAQDLTMGFTDLSNKLAAFNDVDPTEVMEAFKSGLSGSSEPLRRFGINALESSLEARALQDGLLKAGQSFKDIDPLVRDQIRAQALLSQAIANSSDAILGFEENNDSFIRRWQDLQATLMELITVVGATVLPIFDAMVTAITPVVQKISEWVQNNPQLAATLGAIALAISGILVVGGGFLILLGSLAAAAAALGIGLIPLIATTGAVSVAIAAVIAVGALLVANWEWIKSAARNVWNFIIEKFMEVKESISSALTSIANFFRSVFNGLAAFFEFWGTLMLGLLATFFDLFFPGWQEGLNKIFEMFSVVWNKIAGFFSSVWEKIKGTAAAGSAAVNSTISGAWTSLKSIWSTGVDYISNAWKNFWGGASGVVTSGWESTKSAVKSSINWVVDKINWFIEKANAIARKAAAIPGVSAESIPQFSLIPKLAEGGIVTRPTLAMIGEGGESEAVIPLSKLRGGMGGVTIIVQGDVSGEEMIEKVGNALVENLKLSSAVI